MLALSWLMLVFFSSGRNFLYIRNAYTSILHIHKLELGRKMPRAYVTFSPPPENYVSDEDNEGESHQPDPGARVVPKLPFKELYKV